MFRNRLFSLFLLIIFSLWLTACNEEDPTPAPTEEIAIVEPTGTAVRPTNTPIAEPTATVMPPTPTPEPPTATAVPTLTHSPTPTNTPTPIPPTPTPPPDINYQGIQLTYQGIISHTNAAVTTTTATANIPTHTRFYFDNAIPSTAFLQPRVAQIHIYAIADYTSAADQIDALQTLLNEQSTNITGTLPFLPQGRPSETIHAQIRYLPFQNGRGVRFIAQYDQAPGPISNETIFYTFQGLTNNEAYYVAAFFPVTTLMLPATAADVDITIFFTDESRNTYLIETMDTINSIGNDGFTPNLRQIDRVIQSLSIIPEEPVTGETAVVIEESPVVANVGFITGTIHHPSEGVPLTRVYAQSLTSSAFYFDEFFERTYTLAVPPGTYQVFAYTVNTLEGGGYTEIVACEPETECTSHALLPVVVTAGESVPDIDIADWTIPEETLPAPPDGLGATNETPITATPTPEPVSGLGQISGVLSGPDDGSVPAMTIYLQNVANGDFFTIDLEAGFDSYFIELPNGEYIVFAYMVDGEAVGGYTKAVVCGLGEGCDDHTLATVVVGIGESVTDINITDWTIPEDQRPARP